VVEVTGEPHEAVSDQGDAHQADQEHQRNGFAHGADQALAVAGHGQGGADEGHRHGQRDPERQAAVRELT
jgi:hypothetical protein